MRPARFQTFAIEALLAAPEITGAEAWQDKPCGIHLKFSTGSELWIAITGALASSERHDNPEAPVHDEPPAAVTVPDLYVDGAVSPARAEQYLAAILTNTRCTEMARAYPYGTDAVHPGVGVTFHNGARAFMLFAQTARSGQGKGRRQFDLQAAF